MAEGPGHPEPWAGRQVTQVTHQRPGLSNSALPQPSRPSFLTLCLLREHPLSLDSTARPMGAELGRCQGGW